jgi:hypothetical protein
MMRKYIQEEKGTHKTGVEGTRRRRRMEVVALPQGALLTSGQPLLLAESIPLPLLHGGDFIGSGIIRLT